MVTDSEIRGSDEPTRMTCGPSPDTAKVMTLLLELTRRFESRMTSRSEPGPLSLAFVTTRLIPGSVLDASTVLLNSDVFRPGSVAVA